MEGKEHYAPLSALSRQSNVRLASPSRTSLASVLRPVKHKHLSARRLGREQVGVLGHVPSAVDLALVVDRLDRFEARWRARVGAELCF
jgi:hypothetical protein